MFVILKAQDTYKVRQQELRIGKPIETCVFIGDDLPTTYHFGYKIETEIIGVVSAFKQDNKLFDYENQYQIRGMAVLNQYQGTGIGKKLFIEMEQFLITLGINLIWFNARKIALPFYQNISCELIGDSFEIEDVGTHYLMFKKIQ
ncbi:MAG: GNAT family N-acetyltransferase [Flavobacterium sp.]